MSVSSYKSLNLVFYLCSYDRPAAYQAWYVLAVAHRSHGDPQNAMDALDRLVHCGDGAPPEDDEGVLCLREEIERDLEEQQSEEEEEKMES